MAVARSDLDLIAISGSIEGARAALTTDAPLVIGRTSSGFQIPDPLVSIYHAQIGWEDNSYWITDLDSATGTFVDGHQLMNETAQLTSGTVIRIGDTELEVIRRRRFSELEVVAILAPLAIAVFVIAVTLTAAGNRATGLALQWTEPIHRGAAFETTSQLHVPDVYLRQHGMNIRDLRIRRLTDFDLNGRDEVWLRHSERDFIVTFDEQGRWVDLGDVPKGCVDRPLDGRRSLPALDCADVTYDLANGRYRPAQQKGVVVWLRPHFEEEAARRIAELLTAQGEPVPESLKARRAIPERVEAQKGGKAAGFVEIRDPKEESTRALMQSALVRPHRFGLRGSMELAGFLRERGVDEAIHYLICEDALPGVAPQVLTQSGTLVLLGKPCMGDVSVTSHRLGRPALVAFTAEGHRALLADSRTFYGGNPAGIYLAPSHRTLFDWLAGEPGYLVEATQLKFEGPERGTQPVAVENPLSLGRRLLPTGEVEPAPLAVTATLLSRGRAVLDPPGCTMLQIDVNTWSCAVSEGCFPSSTFFDVKEIGCEEKGNLMTASYREGTATMSTHRLDLRSDLTLRQDGDRITVLKAELTYRLKEAAEDPGNGGS
ncbi:MAG: hypothetical protein ACI8PZ_004127 [Myxococcota bacterium]|jgi:hypothetical protein